MRNKQFWKGHQSFQGLQRMIHESFYPYCTMKISRCCFRSNKLKAYPLLSNLTLMLSNHFHRNLSQIVNKMYRKYQVVITKWIMFHRQKNLQQEHFVSKCHHLRLLGSSPWRKCKIFILNRIYHSKENLTVLLTWNKIVIFILIVAAYKCR